MGPKGLKRPKRPLGPWAHALGSHVPMGPTTENKLGPSTEKVSIDILEYIYSDETVMKRYDDKGT